MWACFLPQLAILRGRSDRSEAMQDILGTGDFLPLGECLYCTCIAATADARTASIGYAISQKHTQFESGFCQMHLSICARRTSPSLFELFLPGGRAVILACARCLEQPKPTLVKAWRIHTLSRTAAIGHTGVDRYNNPSPPQGWQTHARAFKSAIHRNRLPGDIAGLVRT